MSKSLTARQNEILQFIQTYYLENNFPPTINEISKFFKISIKGSYDHIKALQKKKYLSCDANKKRSIKLLTLNLNKNNELSDTLEIPILGIVQAGLPILAEENLIGKMKVSKDIFGAGNFFALNVRGDSMIDDGINEGDIAIIKCCDAFNNGDIIVAETPEGVTLKRAYKEPKKIRLEASNKNYKPIFSNNVKVDGKMVGLIRKY